MDGINPTANSGLRIVDCSQASNPQSANSSPQSSPVDRGEQEKMRLARDFESVLLTKLFDQVKESIGQATFDEEDSGTAEQVHGLFWLYMAQDVAAKGGFGMWQDIYQHFSDMEGAHAAGLLVNREL